MQHMCLCLSDRGTERVHTTCVSGGGSPLRTAQPGDPKTAHLRQPQQVRAHVSSVDRVATATGENGLTFSL